MQNRGGSEEETERKEVEGEGGGEGEGEVEVDTYSTERVRRNCGYGRQT